MTISASFALRLLRVVPRSLTALLHETKRGRDVHVTPCVALRGSQSDVSPCYDTAAIGLSIDTSGCLILHRTGT